MMDDDIDGGSAPCFAHHLVDGHPVDPETARDVARFRRSQRARLVAARALPSEERERATTALADGLARIVTPKVGVNIAVYWPIRGEPDLRPWMERAHASGAQVLLPVVVEVHEPIEFQVWSPGCRMTRGFWNIPVPAEGETAVPEIVIAPLVGFDEDLYRLGNGGGYYDRTLVRLQPRPRIIGVGFSGCLLPTIYPMPWDIPMSEVLLSDGTHLKRQCVGATGRRDYNRHQCERSDHFDDRGIPLPDRGPPRKNSRRDHTMSLPMSAQPSEAACRRCVSNGGFQIATNTPLFDHQ